MKKAFLSLLISAGICTLLNSCSSGDYNANPNGSSGGTNQLYTGGGSTGGTNGGGTNGGGVSLGTFTATVNGSAFSASMATALNSSGTLLLAGTNVSSQTSGNEVGITIANYTGAGTYNVNGSTVAISYVVLPSTSYTATSGQIVITSDDATSYQGTFTGTGTGLTITNGKFNVKK